MKERILIIFSVLCLNTGNIFAQNFWQQTNGPIYGSGNGSVNCFAINSRDEIFAGNGNGLIYRSTDNGNSWTQSVVVKNYGLYSIVINSANEIFAAITGNGDSVGVYRSTNNGDSWVKTSLRGFNIFSLAINSSGNIFAAVDQSVYKSTDNGNSWTQSLISDSYRTNSLAINSSGHVFVGTYNGIFRSTDNGNTWMQTGSAIHDVMAIAINSSGDIYISTMEYGVYRSIDNGNNWMQVGLKSDPNIRSLVINSKNYVFAGTSNGVYRSTDNGSSWMKTSLQVSSFSLAINSFGNIFAGTNYSGPQMGIYSSIDNGNTWKYLVPAINSPTINSIISYNRDQVLLGTNNGVYIYSNYGQRLMSFGLHRNIYSIVKYSPAIYFASGDEGSFYRTNDSGKTWSNFYSTMPNSPVKSLVITSSGTLFAGSVGGGVYRMTNIGYPLTLVGLSSSAIYSLAVDLSGNIFAGTYKGVYISTDNGDNWNVAGLSTNSIYALKVDEIGNLFAGSDNGSVYKSNDKGNTWIQVANKITNYPVQTLTINNSGILFVGFNGGGVFRSNDNGSTWTALNAGLTNLNVQCLELDSHSYLYTGTSGSWLFRSINQTAPVISTTQSSVDFGQLVIGDSKQIDITLSDSSSIDLLVSSLKTNDSAFHVYSTAPFSIPTYGSANIHLAFAPKTFGTFLDTLKITSTGGILKIPLYGNCPYPSIIINTNSITFGPIEVFSSLEKTITIKNPSISALDIDSIYTVTKRFSTNVYRGSINKSDSLVVKVIFSPDKIGNFTDTLTIHNNSATAIIRIPLSGFSPQPVIISNLLSVDFGILQTANSAKQVIKFTNNSVNTLSIDSTYLGTKYFSISNSIFPIMIKKSDTISVTLNFNPDSARIYLDTLYIANNSTIQLLKIPIKAVREIISGLKLEKGEIPDHFEMNQNFPNPFNPTTLIKYQLPKDEKVILIIYDILGREVSKLINEEQKAGYYTINFDASILASGLYLYRIQAGSFVSVKKMLLIK